MQDTLQYQSAEVPSSLEEPGSPHRTGSASWERSLSAADYQQLCYLTQFRGIFDYITLHYSFCILHS